MITEEIWKIQKCVLKVKINCGGCKKKVKKILQKIDGVLTIEIDAKQGKVTISGNVDPKILIEKLAKSGKRAELWGAPNNNNNNTNTNNNINSGINSNTSSTNNNNINTNNYSNPTSNNNNSNNNNNNNIANLLKNMQINNGEQQAQNPQQQQLQQQQKGGGQQQAPQQLQQRQQNQQQLQQMKGLQDMKMPQFKDMKMINKRNPNMKAIKFNLPKDDDFFDEELDDDDDSDDEFSNERDNPKYPLNKMKRPMGMGNDPDMMMNGNHPQQLMNIQNGGNGGGGSGDNEKKGGGGGGYCGYVPIQVLNGNEGKKSVGGGNNQNQGGGNKNNGGKNGGGMLGGKNGMENKNDGGGGGGMPNGNEGKKENGIMGEVVQPINSGFPNMGGRHHHSSILGANMGPIGNMSFPMGGGGEGGPVGNMPMDHHIENIPAIQSLSTAAVYNGGGYFPNAVGLDMMPGNPYQQQQQAYMATMMMNQQKPMENDRFQPMMYARPHAPFNYVYPPPSYPYPNYFNDENTSSCSVM